VAGYRKIAMPENVQNQQVQSFYVGINGFEGRFGQFVKHVKEKEVLNLILIFDNLKKNSKDHQRFHERIGKNPAVLSG
jgi:hypothetical protein